MNDVFNKCDQSRSFLRIWSHLLKKFLIENFIFCAMNNAAILQTVRRFFLFFDPKHHVNMILLYAVHKEI